MRLLTEALTFDDVSLVPAESNVLPKDVSTSTRLTRGIGLNIPVVSAAMDTVTEARLAITMAQHGGIGIIHKNMPPERQATEVRLVKKFEAGVIRDPITVTPDTSIRDVIAITRARNISGVPVVDGEELVGIVTSRDLRFETHLDAPVSAIMTPKPRLVTVPDGASDEAVLALLHKHRIEKVLVVNDQQPYKTLKEFVDDARKNPNKLTLATQGKEAFEDRKLRIPMGRADLRADLHKLQRVTGPTGTPRFVADSDAAGHADRTWAGFLAINAAANPAAPIAFKSLSADRAGGMDFRGYQT